MYKKLLSIITIFLSYDISSMELSQSSQEDQSYFNNLPREIKCEIIRKLNLNSLKDLFINLQNLSVNRELRSLYIQYIIKLYFKEAVEDNKKMEEIYQALMNACRNNKITAISILLKCGVNVNFAKERQWTPLMAACYQNNLEIVKLLLDAGAITDIAFGHTGETPLKLACRTQNLEIVKLLIAYKADVNFAKESCWAPFITACSTNNLEIVKLLLYAGAITDRDKEIFEYTPLILACEKQNVEIVKLLIAYKADVNFAKEGEWTPLMIACYKNNLEIVKLLLDAGATVNIQVRGKTAFNYATAEIRELLNKYKSKEMPTLTEG